MTMERQLDMGSLGGNGGQEKIKDLHEFAGSKIREVFAYLEKHGNRPLDYGISHIAHEIGDTDPEITKQAIHILKELGSFDTVKELENGAKTTAEKPTVAEAAQKIQEYEKTKPFRFIEGPGIVNIKKIGKLAAEIGDIEKAKQAIQNLWVYNDESYYAITDIAIQIAEKDPGAAREVMKKLEAKGQWGPMGRLAVVLGELEKAKQAMGELYKNQYSTSMGEMGYIAAGIYKKTF